MTKTEKSQNPSSTLGGRLIPESGMDSLTEAIMKEIKRRTNNNTSSSVLGEALAPSEGLPTPGVIIGLPIETPSASPPPPHVSVEELPSDSPGCRTLATKTCYKTPVIINKKVKIYIFKLSWTSFSGLSRIRNLNYSYKKSRSTRKPVHYDINAGIRNIMDTGLIFVNDNECAIQ